jgi:hypothetical protein
MEIINIEIVNPKAMNILNDLAELKLIRIKSRNRSAEFVDLLKELRAESENAPSFEEIAKEVEVVRNSRHEK